MVRRISVLLRRLHSKKWDKRKFVLFDEWKRQVENITVETPNKNHPKKLLIIRLDDIGDYLLFRNTLPWYHASERWKAFEISLLGNEAWKPLFNMLDNKTVDKTFWINKHAYDSNETYRHDIWRKIIAEQFDVVICPSRTRPLLLDDVCAFCCKTAIKIATQNTFANTQVNAISDAGYNELFPHDNQLHEFFFNQAFARKYTNSQENLSRPVIDIKPKPVAFTKPYILCCIGANEKSRRWPVERWIELINMCAQYNLPLMVLCGGEGEKANAAIIMAKGKADSIVAKVSLTEFVDYAANATALICNDSMAAHLGVSLNRPTVIISNGNNFPRFTTYYEAGINNVETVYAQRFLKTLKRKRDPFLWNYIAVTKDTKTIKAKQVFEALKEVAGL